MPDRHWLLTDAAAGVWVEAFAAVADGCSVRRRTLHGGLSDGVEVVEVDNGALRFTVLPTRGLGLWRAAYRGLALQWDSPVRGPVHPKFVNLEARNGLGWLEGFDELLCRCGLASNGPPGDDGGARLTLHGRIANRPAHHVRASLSEDGVLRVTGEVEESGLFCGRLRLTATYETAAYSNALTVRDVVENVGGQPAEFELLYHLNVGAPVLAEGSRVALPFRELAPLTPRAAEGIDTWDTYAAPQAGYAEQVYVAEPLADAAGRTLAVLHNPARSAGLAVRWAVRELPCFTLWKNTAAAADGYVTGLEPATNYPNFRAFEREKGRVLTLPPGGRWQATWTLEAFDTAAGVAAALEEVTRVQAAAGPAVHRTPQAKYSRV
jgi:galactose mutarotase-like enzyme